MKPTCHNCLGCSSLSRYSNPTNLTVNSPKQKSSFDSILWYNWHH
jgi:hypothetical protein